MTRVLIRREGPTHKNESSETEDMAVSQEHLEGRRLEEAEGPSWKPSEGAALPPL